MILEFKNINRHLKVDKMLLRCVTNKWMAIRSAIACVTWSLSPPVKWSYPNEIDFVSFEFRAIRFVGGWTIFYRMSTIHQLNIDISIYTLFVRVIRLIFDKSQFTKTSSTVSIDMYHLIFILVYLVYGLNVRYFYLSNKVVKPSHLI